MIRRQWKLESVKEWIKDGEIDLNPFAWRLKGHSQLRDRADLDTTFSGLKGVYLNPKSNVLVGYIEKCASILPSVPFDPRSITDYPSFEQTFTHPITFFFFIILG